MSEISLFLPGFFAAYAILLVGASSPGPSVAMLMGIATNEGRNPALIATLGIALGSVTINVLTLLGVGLVLSNMAWGMTALRIIGAAYLLYLAYGAFKKAIDPPVFQRENINKSSAFKHFSKGYLLQVTNPKAIAFWLAIASIGATTGGGTLVVFLFCLGAFCISFGCHAAWAIALSASPIRSAYAKARRYIEAGLGTFFCFAAFKVATLKT